MNSLNKTTVVSLTNKSGGSVAKGDVVVLSGSTANAFTTTTSAALTTDMVGVVVEPNGIADNASGMVALAGYVGQVNLSASASLGDTFGTHTVAKQAAPHASMIPGDFGQVLATGTTPDAMLWGKPNSVSTTSYAQLSDQRASGEVGGAASTNVWSTHSLTSTMSDDNDVVVSLAANQFVLAPGTYSVNASATFYSTQAAQIRLYNVTGATALVVGIAMFFYNVTYVGGLAVLSGQFTVAVGQTLELQYYVNYNSGGTQTLGVPIASGSDECFANVDLIKH